MEKAKKIKTFVNIIPFLLVFLVSLHFPIDRDLGWHLKSGEYIFQNGHPIFENTFSSDMEGYRWVDPSFGVDLITYLTFSLFGFVGLSLMGSALITLIFYIFSRVGKLSIWSLSLSFSVCIIFLYPVFVNSFRGQLLSYLALSILFFIVVNFFKNPSNRIFFLIPIFWVWANTHSQFIFGLMLFLGWILIFLMQNSNKILKKNHQIQKQATLLVLVFVSSVLITLVNSYGINLYSIVFDFLRNRETLGLVEEWSAFRSGSLGWWLINLAVLSVLGITYFMYRINEIKSKLFLILTVLGLLVQGYFSQRYAFNGFFFLIPLLGVFFSYIEPKKGQLRSLMGLLILIAVVCYIILDKNPLNTFVNPSWGHYCREVKCSTNAAEFLIKHDTTQNLYSYYGWGGWLIWNYPDIKPSIDGRMHLWRDEKGYSAFENYILYELNIKDIDESSYDVVFIPPTRRIYFRLMKLVDEGKWELVYHDQYAAIFVRSE